jgi:hypothetical protein
MKRFAFIALAVIVFVAGSASAFIKPVEAAGGVTAAVNVTCKATRSGKAVVTGTVSYNTDTKVVFKDERGRVIANYSFSTSSYPTIFSKNISFSFAKKDRKVVKYETYTVIGQEYVLYGTGTVSCNR